MIIVINDNVIHGVKIDTRGYPVIPDEYLDKLKSDSSCEWPYVYIPSITPSQRVECELGYWNNANLSKKVCPIVYDNVSIQSIYISLEKKQIYEWSGGFQYAIDKYKFYYHYEITLLLKNDNNCCNYKFVSDDYIELNNGRKECSKMRTMKRLFKRIIPMLNEFISKGFPIDQLNRCYVQSCFPQRDDNYFERYYIHDYNRFKQIIYSSRINTAHGDFFLEIGRGVMPFINRHVGVIISSILGVSFIRDSSEEFIYGDVTNLLEIKFLDERLLLPYCIAKLFFNAELIYSENLANKEIMLAVPEEMNKHISTYSDNSFYNPSLDVVKMVDFILNIEAEHKRDGQYRVGRDDLEWEYKRFSFPLKHSYSPSQNLISVINSVLKIKLEKHEDAYSYSETLDKGYVPWLVREEDLGSDELKKTSMSKIFNKIYSIYLTDPALFQRLIKE